MASVAFKIGRGQGGFAGASPSRAVTANPTQPPAYFQCNPKGCGNLAIFPRCSLGQDRYGYYRFARALNQVREKAPPYFPSFKRGKNGQIDDSRCHAI